MSKPIFKALFWEWSGTLFQQATVFTLTVVLARLLSPEDFGLLGMAMVVISVAHIFSEAGLQSALVQRKDCSSLTYDSVFFLNIILGCIVGVIVFLLAPMISNFYGRTELVEIVRWLSLVFILNSFNVVQISILQKELNFKALNFRLNIATLTGGVLGIIAAFYGLGVYSLIIQNVTRALVGTIFLWIVSHWKPRIRMSFAEIKKMSSFSSYVFIDQIFMSISNQIDILVVGKIFSASTLGFYTRAVTLQHQVTKLTSTSLTKVFYPVLSAKQQQPEQFNNVFNKLFGVTTVTVTVLTIILLSFGKPLILLLLGDKWLPSVDIFEIIIFLSYAVPVNAVIINAFMSIGKAKENFLIGIFRKAFKLLPIIFALISGLKGLIVSIVIVNFILMFFNILMLKKYKVVPVEKLLLAVSQTITPLILGGFLFYQLEPQDILERLVFTFFFLLINVLVLWKVKNAGLEFLIIKIRSYFKIM